MAAEVCVSRHPLVRHKLTLLRDASTPPPLFRRLVAELAQLLFAEASRDLPTVPAIVRTPLAECTGYRIAETVGLVPILRAGLGMAQAILETIPTAQVWHLGLYRDHQTHKPVTYYSKLTPPAPVGLAVLLDPMLATGGSAVAAVTLLRQWGPRRIKFLGLIAAPEGVRTLQAAHPDVTIHLGAIDDCLDANAYIVPGLGDAGDRQFGTA